MNAVSSVVKNLLQLQCLVFLLLIAVTNGAAADAAPLPQNCTTTCVTPYGAVLGSTLFILAQSYLQDLMGAVATAR